MFGALCNIAQMGSADKITPFRDRQNGAICKSCGSPFEVFDWKKFPTSNPVKTSCDFGSLSHGAPADCKNLSSHFFKFKCHKTQ